MEHSNTTGAGLRPASYPSTAAPSLRGSMSDRYRSVGSTPLMSALHNLPHEGGSSTHYQNDDSLDSTSSGGTRFSPTSTTGPPVRKGHSADNTPQTSPSKSGWHRPWKASPRRRWLVPLDQTDRWRRTESRVDEAVYSIQEITGELAHTALVVGTKVLPFAPIPGLAEAADILLNIWDAVQMVDSNRLACLRLTERCADILVAIHQDIREAGEEVRQDLARPTKDLERTFNELLSLIQHQNNQPFLKRYLNRDEMLGEIEHGEKKLTDCQNSFHTSIVTRILAHITQLTSPSLPTRPLPQSFQRMVEGGGGDATREMGPTHHSLSDKEIRARLRKLHEQQNAKDRARDTDDLRQLLQQALDTNDHTEMVRVLQVGRHEMPEAIKTLLRALEQRIQIDTRDLQVLPDQPAPSPTRSLTWPLEGRRTDLLDREFIEREIRALQQEAKGLQLDLPSWTITKYEIDLGELIGRGFFADVYRGRWRRRAVAIRVLETATAEEAFVNEVEIWRSLHHVNVLELYGASSTTSDPPWFLVSPFMKHGSVSDYLKRLRWGNRGQGISSSEVDLLGMMHDVAKGMEYLHQHGILHGGLKAANVLVSDKLRCVVSDFGQSKFKVHVTHENTVSHHGIRWQAPELMSGQSLLTKKVDVYAYAICCVEILTMGSLPWPMMHDDVVRHCVLNEGTRPYYPPTLVDELGVEELLHSAWHVAPSARPSFPVIAETFIGLKDRALANAQSPRIVVSHVDIEPDNLNSLAGLLSNLEPTVQDGGSSPLSLLMLTDDDSGQDHDMPQDAPVSLRDGDEAAPDPSASVDSLESTIMGLRGLGEEPPNNASEDRDEVAYRLCLSHGFDSSLTLPLWTPTFVSLGDVGYLSKPDGRFVTLCNSIDPSASSGGRLPEDMFRLDDFGPFSTANQLHGTTSLTKRGRKAFAKLMSGGDDASLETPKRTYSFTLTGDAAHLYTGKPIHRSIKGLKACEMWFKVNYDQVLRTYGAEHFIQKEDLMLVVGTLDVRDYALLVSHGDSDQKAFFNVHRSRQPGEPWGSFSIDTHEGATPLFAEKVSRVGGENTVLVARLRFPPDKTEPTLL